jgi:hypothetical protein
MIVIYLVITYRQEDSLSRWLRWRSQAGSLAPPELAHFVGQVASSLQHAHDWQIIHQDVNSANFLLRSETPKRPDPLLADIDTAHFSTATSSASLSIRGTPTLMASEQLASASAPVAENTILTADPAAPATSVPIGNNKGQHPAESGAARPEMTVSPSPAVESTKATTPASQVLPTATKLALPRELSGGRPTETTLPNQVRQRAGVVSADRLSLLPAPITAQPQRDISRRAFMLRLAGLTVVSAAGSSLVLLACGQQPAAPASPASLPKSKALYTYQGHSGAVYAVIWSPDGKRIASGGTDGTVQVWNAADGGHVFTYRGHSDVVEVVAWSHDGKRIALGSREDTVQVWDATDGGHVFTYRGHSNVVEAVAWSPDGKRIASASDDNTVQVWVAT